MEIQEGKKRFSFAFLQKVKCVLGVMDLSHRDREVLECV